MDNAQFEKNKLYINKKLSEEYPGVKMRWDENDNPSLDIPTSRKTEIDEIINCAIEIVADCGGEYEFHKAKAKEL